MAWAVALKSLYVQFGLVRKCSRNILWGTLGDGLWRLSPPLNGALGGTGLDRQVLSGLCMVLLLKGASQLVTVKTGVLMWFPDKIYTLCCTRSNFFLNGRHYAFFKGAFQMEKYDTYKIWLV